MFLIICCILFWGVLFSLRFLVPPVLCVASGAFVVAYVSDLFFLLDVLSVFSRCFRWCLMLVCFVFLHVFCCFRSSLSLLLCFLFPLTSWAAVSSCSLLLRVYFFFSIFPLFIVVCVCVCLLFLCMDVSFVSCF